MIGSERQSSMKSTCHRKAIDGPLLGVRMCLERYPDKTTTLVRPRHTARATSRVVRLKRRNSTSYWAIASATLVILLAAINLAGCRPAHSQDDPRTLPQLVEIATVRLADAPERAFTGVVVARVQSNLGFRVPG